MAVETPLASNWKDITFPREDSTQLARQVYNNVFTPSAIYQGATKYFTDQPRSKHLTIVCGGLRVPPDVSAFYVTLRAIEIAGNLFYKDPASILEENHDTEVLDLNNATPTILHGPLPSLTELRNMRHVASHGALYCRQNPNFQTGVGYVALCHTPDRLIALAGYGDLTTGERAEKPIDLAAINKRNELQSKRTITIDMQKVLRIPGLGPVI